MGYEGTKTSELIKINEEIGNYVDYLETEKSKVEEKEEK